MALLLSVERPSAQPGGSWHWGRENFDPATGVVIHDAGKIGGTGGGMSMLLAREAVTGRESVTLEYDVTLSANWQWVKSGKFPGLFSGETDFGPSRAPDGRNGFTIRPVWAAGGRIGVYVYDMHVQGYGRGPTSDKPCLVAGRTHRVRLSTKLNRPGRRDGVVTLAVDGVVQAQMNDAEFRVDPALTLTGVWWTCFYGGGDASWAPTERVLCQLQNMRLAA